MSTAVTMETALIRGRRLSRRSVKLIVAFVLLAPYSWAVAPHPDRSCSSASSSGWAPWILTVTADKTKGDGPFFSYNTEGNCVGR